jgi:multidrug resistance efflux pump
MEMNINSLKHAVNSQAAATDKANTLLDRLEKLYKQTVTTMNEAQNRTKDPAEPNPPYKDTLLNSHRNASPQTLQTPTSKNFSTVSTSRPPNY